MTTARSRYARTVAPLKSGGGEVAAHGPMRAAVLVTAILVVASGCSDEAVTVVAQGPPRPCASATSDEGDSLELCVDVTEPGAVSVEVLQSSEVRERITVALAGAGSSIVVEQDGNLVYSADFAVPGDVVLPLDLSLAALDSGRLEDAGLQALADAARGMPRLDRLAEFADILPVGAVLETDRSGFVEYGDAGTQTMSLLVDTTKTCTAAIAAEQDSLRRDNCNQSWGEYVATHPISDYDCLLCGLLMLDPCTGLPIDGEALLACLLGPIGCAIWVGAVILLYAKAAN